MPARAERSFLRRDRLAFESAGIQAPCLAPFSVEPQFVVRVWGSHDLRPWYQHLSEGDPIGEVWLTGDACRAASGIYAGETLEAIFAKAGASLLGTEAHGTASPLLLKTIFAKDKLSVQVHPDDRLAQKYGNPRGKTECWYALAAEEGAQVACGIKPGVSIEKIEEGIRTGSLEESLSLLDVHAGDMIFVDAGTVHAIWPGSVLLETQQNCDLTYRMYDYGRPRELHIAKSLEATRLVTQAGKIEPRPLDDRSVLVDANYFRVERIDMQKISANGLCTASILRGAEGSVPGLAYIFAANGSARISSVDGSFEDVLLVERGVVAIPALSPDFVLEDLGGLELIRITPKWPTSS